MPSFAGSSRLRWGLNLSSSCGSAVLRRGRIPALRFAPAPARCERQGPAQPLASMPPAPATQPTDRAPGTAATLRLLGRRRTAPTCARCTMPGPICCGGRVPSTSWRVRSVEGGCVCWRPLSIPPWWRRFCGTLVCPSSRPCPHVPALPPGPLQCCRNSRAMQTRAPPGLIEQEAVAGGDVYPAPVGHPARCGVGAPRHPETRRPTLDRPSSAPVCGKSIHHPGGQAVSRGAGTNDAARTLSDRKDPSWAAPARGASSSY